MANCYWMKFLWHYVLLYPPEMYSSVEASPAFAADSRLFSEDKDISLLFRKNPFVSEHL